MMILEKHKANRNMTKSYYESKTTLLKHEKT